MEKTPLELYETAYKLHYTDHRISEASVYYQRLIKEFPDSNECGYSVIQLQKIKAGDVAKDLSETDDIKKSSSPAMAAVLILLFIVAGGAGYLALHFKKQLETEQKRHRLALNALSKISRGNHEDALALLSELKKIDKRDIFAYELSADIYRKDDKYDLAKNEYTTFFQMNPHLAPSENEAWFMNLAEFKKAKNVKAPVQPVAAVPAEVKSPVVKPDPVPLSKKTAVQRNRKKGVPPPPPPAKTGTDHLIVDPDSISYF